jgi:putative NADH-flavin reductase
MKLLIFGATGGTGSQVVQQALEKGFQVTAFVRSPEKITVSNRLLKVVKGDVLQQSSIDLIMPGHDAVICCIGAPPTKAGVQRSEGTNNILRSMEKFGIKRFVCQASLGYDDSAVILKNTPFVFRKIIVPLLLKKTFEEHSKQEKIIRQSNTSWTIVRPGSLTNGKLTAQYYQGDDYTNDIWKVKISRADVAHFLVGQVTDERYMHRAVGVSC